MKKKLFLFISTVFALICLFAVSSSALHTYTPLTEDDLANLDVKITLTDGTKEFDSTIKFTDLFNYTLTQEPYSLELTGIKATATTVNEVEYTLKSSMVALYFPDGVTHLGSDFMKNYSTVISRVHLPDSIESIADEFLYKAGEMTLVDINGNADNFLPENLTVIGDQNGTGDSHFMSGWNLQNDMLVFPEGVTSFASSYAFNDGFSQKDNKLTLVFLGKMTTVNLPNTPQNSAKMSLYFAKNNASDAYVTANGSVCNKVEVRLIEDSWYYVYKNAITGADISTPVDTTSKKLKINIANNDPNSSSNEQTIDEKAWYKFSSQAPVFYFCSGEMILTARNSTFDWKVYASDPIASNDVHPYNDGGKTVEPTCEIGGGTRYSCGVCGAFLYLEDSTEDALGHDYDESDFISSKELTCTQDETKTYKCTRCNEDVTVIIKEAQGHSYSVITYPVEATYTSLGIKNVKCANCDAFKEYEYRLDPGGATMTVIMDDDTELSVLASLIFNYTFNEESQLASISGFNSAFTVDEKTYSTNDIKKIVVPFGFNHVGYGFANSYAIEIFDFSLTNSLSVGEGAFRDNKYIEQVILGDNMTIQADAFRCPAKMTSLIIPDNATVVFSINANVFNDNRTLEEIIVGKNANVNFARSNLITDNMKKTLVKLEIGDGSTVSFGSSSFLYTTALEQFTIGNNCTVNFGSSSFSGSAISQIQIGTECDITIGSNAFKGSGLTSFEFSKENTYSLGARAFESAKSLKTVIFEDNSKVSLTGDQAFYSSGVEYVYFGKGYTTLNNKLFDCVPTLKTVILMNVTSIGEYFFCTGTDSSTAEIEGYDALTVYSHASADLSINSNTFANRTANGVILYTNATNITSLNKVPYTIYCGIPHEQYEHTEAETCLANGYIGYKTDCPCGTAVYDVTYTVYTSASEEASTGSFDSITVIDEFDGHDVIVTIKYDDGFDKAGSKTTTCSRCSDIDSTATASAIFTANGYSVSENGKALLGGYSINSEALKEYNKYNKALTYGIIMSNASNVTISDGKYTGGKGVMVSETNENYSTVQYVISGYTATQQLVDLQLVITLYVVDGNGNMSFIQNDTAYTTAPASVDDNSVSLNSITLGYIAKLTLTSDKSLTDTQKDVLNTIVSASDIVALPVTTSDDEENQ
ncbi:MAG: leucine-rich repeat protein [Clostridia bacterium]|nr:leucine-rich repeat protein [Clostridia bacterium]